MPAMQAKGRVNAVSYTHQMCIRDRDKVDPLVDRVSLTVDAANLEIMRLDRILELSLIHI